MKTNKTLELNVDVVCEYHGDGLWSGKQFTSVPVSKIVLHPEIDDDMDGYKSDAYMYAVFDPCDWDTCELGLPYTSESFLESLRDLLRNEIGDLAEKISWTEHGMQGDNFASICVEASNDVDLFRQQFAGLCQKYDGKVLK